MRIFSLLLAVLLGGCRITTFEQAPLAVQACDPQLAGRWLSLGDSPDSDGEVELRIDRDCRLQLGEYKQGAVRRSDDTQLQLGSHDGRDYAWLDAGWVQRQFDPDAREWHPHPGDLYLVRYRLDGDRLTLQAPDSVAIAHRIIDGDIPGEVRYSDSRLYNRITGTAQPALLGRDGFFDPKPIAFGRVQPDPVTP